MPACPVPILEYASKSFNLGQSLVGYRCGATAYGTSPALDVPGGAIDMVYNETSETHDSSHTFPDAPWITYAYGTWATRTVEMDATTHRFKTVYSSGSSGTYGFHNNCGLSFDYTQDLSGDAAGWSCSQSWASKAQEGWPGHVASSSEVIGFSGGVNTSTTYDTQLQQCAAYFEAIGGFSDTVHVSPTYYPARLKKGWVAPEQGRQGWHYVEEYCQSRFRFRIPSTWGNPYAPEPFPGSYFKITFDLLNEPDEGDASLVSEGITIVWTGPGDHDSPDGDSWLSDWQEIPMPTEPGETRVVNIRYECYRSKFGTKPQVTGDAWEPPS